MRKWIFSLTVSALLLSLLSACGAVPLLSGVGIASSSSDKAGGPSVQSSAPNVAQVQPTGQPQPVVSGRALVVTGTGRATLAPDMAYVNIGVHTEGPDVTSALSQNKDQTQKVVDAIKALGIEDKDIQTTNFNIYPMNNYSPTGEITTTKYAIDNTVYVTVRDLSKLGDLLDKAASAGANNINGIQFDVADRAAALADARKSAVANAEEQAKQLAEYAGVQLGDIQSISTTSASVPVPVYGRGMGGGAAAPAVDQVPVSPGQLIVSVDVTLAYEIK